MTETLPPLTYLSLPAVESLTRARLGQAWRVALGAVLTLSAWSVFVNAQGAYLKAAECWNVDPANIDRNPASQPDVLADLEKFPYPFADNSFDRITAIHVIEHLGDVIRAMEEFHRLLRPGGTLRIETPHYTDYSSFCDPTHKNHLNSFSFRYFGPNHGGFGYYSAARFREISVRVKLLAFWRWLGFEFLVNHFPRYRRFWEYSLCYVVRGKVMQFEFEVMK